jgi:hypothetical protein
MKPQPWFSVCSRLPYSITLLRLPSKAQAFSFHTIYMKTLVNNTWLQKPWVGSQWPNVIYAAAADSVCWFSVGSITTIYSQSPQLMAFLYEITIVSLYMCVIIYSCTVCKWLHLTILDMDTKWKITSSEKLNVICEVKANPATLLVEIANRLGLAP